MAAHAAQKKIGVMEKNKNWNTGVLEKKKNWSVGVIRLRIWDCGL
jgi:hypothetical protein